MSARKAASPALRRQAPRQASKQRRRNDRAPMRPVTTVLPNPEQCAILAETLGEDAEDAAHDAERAATKTKGRRRDVFAAAAVHLKAAAQILRAYPDTYDYASRTVKRKRPAK